MGILAMILVFIVLILTAACTHDTWDFYNDVRQQRVDRSKLIADTVLLCGTHIICNQSAIPFPVLPETKQQVFSCAPCKCDVDCWLRGDCCIDLPYLYLTSSCQSTQLIFNGSNVKISSEFNFKMIASCRETEVGIEMKKECDGFKNEGSFLDYDLQAPVTSVITHITYRNKYCASCHRDHDVIHWERFARCQTPFDISTISTMNEFKYAFAKYNCFLLYQFPSSLPPMPLNPCIYNKWYNIISTCNKTGLWVDYDPSIEWACENFEPGDIILKNFRNIFCYMCNPSIATIHHDMIIDHCNMTGEWQLYDKGLEDGCLNLPSIRRLRPFKNSYCMLCNGREPLSNTFKGHLGNLSFIISSFLPESIAHIKFSETSLSNLLGNRETDWERRVAEFNIEVETAKSDYIKGDHTKNIYMKNSSFFLSYDIFQELQLICGENSVCVNSDQDGYSSNTNTSHAAVYSNFPISPCGVCNCNKTCLYDKTCCVDLLLNENPYDRISNEIFPSARDQDTSSISGILAISTCRNISQPAFIRDMCHQRQFSNLISLLPGISDRSVIFKNVFCSYCHDFKNNFQPLDMKITCPIQLEPTMFLSFSSLLTIALQSKCNIRFVHSDFEDNEKESLMVSNCNTTGEWHDYDERVQNMCEMEKSFSVLGLRPMLYQKHIYKNIFCFMCNPEISTESVIRHCNVTGKWNVYDPVFEQACEDAPEHIVWSPYKNWFCSRCNEDMGIGRYQELDTTQIYEYPSNALITTYRSLFSFKLPTSIDLRKEEITCSNGIYDSYKMACTNVYCPVGRELKNESCIVLLEETNNLRYSITLQLVSVSDHAMYNGDLQILIQNISSTIMDIMWRLENNLEIEYSKTWSYQPCEERQIAGSATIAIKIPSIFFHAKLRVHITRNRSALELALLDFRKRTFQVEYNRANLMFETTLSSMVVPDDSDSTTLCRHDYTAFDNNNFQYSIRSYSEENEYIFEYKHVSDLLACVMVQVSKNDYVYNNQTETIMLINTSTTLQRHDFEFQKDESIRVCRTHLNQDILTHPINTSVFLYQASLMASIHNIFSYICTMISIICLVITFLTYCLFKTLRSLPGKNNMCLVLCLLCAQTLLQFGLWQSHYPIMCNVLAIGIHFFWMATFSSMNVCSFHMYRVFCSNALAILTDDDSKKILMWYIAYICAVPFSLILATTTINSSLSNGENIGYGGERCFLNNQYSIIFAFIVPALAIFISNAVFFAIAFHKIRSSPSIESNSADKRNFFMYVKLSTITGVAWPLQIIDGLLELSVFSFFVTFVNALQGMFIFTSYICNRRTWKLYMENCCRRKKPKESWTRVVSNIAKSGTEHTYI